MMVVSVVVGATSGDAELQAMADLANSLSGRQPQRRYTTIVVDPPWAYQQKWMQAGKGNALTHDGLAGVFDGGIRGAAAHYACMSLDEISAMPIGEWAEADSHLYLWTTNAFIPHAFDIIRSWGFDYKTKITWIKRGLGMGMYFRNTTEDVLFAVRGNLKLLRRDLPTHIMTRRRPHSSKPPEFYEMFESASPGPRLDVFARGWHPGFDQWGDEVGAPPGLPTPDQVRARVKQAST